MNERTNYNGIGFILTISIILCVIVNLVFFKVIISKNDEIKNITEKAIESQCAYYHPKTGEFTWGSK